LAAPICKADPSRPVTFFEEPPLPTTLFLCGEAFPLERRDVREMLDRELTIAAWDRAQVFMWLKRAGRFFPYIEKRLSEEGLPDDLKYLAVAESSLILTIRSPRGALGTWQFMPRTATRNGLRKDRRVDERKDFERATDAALRYLKRLHDVFDSWPLALAAYNCGDVRLKKEMEKQREKDFFSLNLPRETERYLYRIASIKLILEDPAKYGYRANKERIYQPIPCDRIQVKVRSSIPITDVAKALDTTFKTIKELNPHIHGYHMPTGIYYVRVPEGKGTLLSQTLKRMGRVYAKRQAGDINGDVYVVQRGDTLSRISRRSGVPVSTIKRINGIKGSLIRVGQRIKLKP
jgi:hypothetical protein